MPRISATGFSYWATPLSNRRQTTPSQVSHGARLANQVAGTIWPTPSASIPNDRERAETWIAGREVEGQRGVPLSIAVQLYPTPTAAAAVQGPNEPDGKRGQTLISAVQGEGWTYNREEIAARLYPTPTASGNSNSKGSSPKSSDGLATSVKRSAGSSGDETPPTAPLNPEWVEWLMGFPSGWTALED